MSLSSFFSSFLPTTHAEEAPETAVSESKREEEEPVKEEEAAEEEEEPEDSMPALREACQETECKKYTHHFLACQERVQAGEVQYKGEDCVEEIMMHCADNCLAPKLFSKLR
ncbi:ubiquinol-cytochrome C reductase hinge protein-domain-containing protein [Vararia minispora EC-137]|uniref:Ubiquinol-cytochrome C reductase hinge protein-domain-containing protein n=1 Tax=Vararia minispora EC-137 TaxID=1314806 RepID=A0ACB8Q677_9AGAM|nr:ubiquinol-cytochrome C reductase hinge protein-domain-containing protein [Vararia minispora EC-137]